MEWIVYVLIVIFFALLAIYVFHIVKNKKNYTDDIINMQLETIESLVSQLDILIELAKENDKIQKELVKLQDKLRYISPCDNKKILIFDNTLKSEIQQLKELVLRAKVRGSYLSVTRKISQIELVILERNANEK